MPVWLERLLDATVAAMVALFTPLLTIMGSMVFLVLCDLVTGILKAKKQGELITSYGIKRTVAKLGVYLLVILMSHVTELYLTQGTIPVLNVVASIIGITELKSCVENINILTGGGVLDAVVRAISKHVPPKK